MQRRRTTLALSLALSLASILRPTAVSQASAPAIEPLVSPGVSIFRGVTVLGMGTVGEVFVDHDVEVRDGVIWSVAPSGRGTVLPGTRVIDGTGKFLLPGLTDMHVHLQGQADLFLYLAHGVTTVFDLSGSPETLALRRAVAQGEVAGPQVFTTGPALGGDPPLNPRFVRLRNAAEARSAVDRLKGEGYDAIKVYSGILPEAFSAATARAGELGLPVFGHLPWALRAEGALQPGTLSAVAHAEELFAGFYSPTSRYMSGDHQWLPASEDLERTPELVRLMRQSAASLIVNGRFIDRMVAQAEDLEAVLAEPQVALLPGLQQLSWRQSRYARRDNPARALRRQRAQADFVPRFVERLAAADLPLLIGSDAAVPGAVPGYSALMEILYLERRCGLSPVAALAAATHETRRFFARYLPGAAPFGEVRAGFRADLLLLGSDPRLSTEALATSRIGVMAAGRWYPAAELVGELARRSEENRLVTARLLAAFAGFETGDLTTSETELSQLLAEHPAAREDVEGLLVAAGTHAARSQPGSDFVAAWSRMAVGLLPESSALRMALVDTLIERGATAAARQQLEEVLAREPDHAAANRRLEEIDAGH